MGCGQSTQPQDIDGPLPENQAQAEPVDAQQEQPPQSQNSPSEPPLVESDQAKSSEKSQIQTSPQPASTESKAAKELKAQQLLEKERSIPNPFGKSKRHSRDPERSGLEESAQPRGFEPGMSVDFSASSQRLGLGEFNSTQNSRASPALASVVHRPSGTDAHEWYPAGDANGFGGTDSSLGETFGPAYNRLGRNSALPRAGSALSCSSSDEVVDRIAVKRRSSELVVRKSQDEQIADILNEMGGLSMDDF
eukprot:TRINITY_DN5064_c0_g1_i1.p1 TRINITY_DN5064_c0_g1~~TRINITY_DN5064_c0_g1_i1.p1  ORF type:complete len:250 (-),score=39.28 TRINITY_DN5064_c0_g1_i1:221-970(-)